MSKILVAYSTNSGSTGEVAEAIASELGQGGHVVEVHQISEVKDLNGYDAVVVGAPMIFGWHNKACRFLRLHQKELATKKVAYFACAMSLTQTPGTTLPTVPLTLDPNLVSEPKKPGSLNFKERFTSIKNYLQPIMKAAPGVNPVGVAFFKGRLEMFRLKWWQAAFVMIVIQGVPGDYRDWDFIKAWGQTLSQVL